MWLQLILSLHLVCCLSTVGGVGIKRRLAEAEEAEKAHVAASTDNLDIAEEASSSSTGRRGGVRQRTAGTLASDDGPSSQDEVGPLFKRLVKKWASGKCSAAEMQRDAMAAQGQGAIGMARMAAIGSSGDHPQNAYRSLKAMLGIPKGAPSILLV